MGGNTSPSASGDGVTPRSSGGSSSTHKRVRKQCSSAGCAKVDAGGGFCVGHGGGKKCSFPGCEKGYQTGGFCRKHGGGARCQVPGCGKVDAGKGLCRGHGGGRRCQTTDCPKADVGGGYCTAHGGGRRCTEPDCSKIDQGGGKCRAHGGAKRCLRDDCTQTARGASGLCPDHGGAKICSVANCRRLARGDDSALCLVCEKEHEDGAAKLVKKTTPRAVRRNSPTSTPSASKRRRVSKNSASSTSSDEGMRTSDSEERKPAVTVTPPMEPVIRAVYSPALPPLTALSVPMLATSVTRVTPELRDTKCDGSHVASCLKNGCARSYGGDCRCPANCGCNRTADKESDEASAASDSSDDQVAAITLQRYILQIKQQHSSHPPLAFDAILALIVAANGIRSAHDVSSSSASLTVGTSEEDSKETYQSLLHLIAIRSDKALDIPAVLAPLQRLEVNWFVLEQSEVPWSRKEVVLRVPAMMCPGNCGNSVVNAIRMVKHVESANLVFASRQVVARGRMCVDELSDAVNAIGFEPHVDAVTPLPNRFRFRVNELADVAFVGRKLERLLKTVEGVESVVVYVELAEVLVVAMVENASSLVQTASQSGVVMVEIPDSVSSSVSTLDPFNSTQLGSASDTGVQTAPLEDSDGRHLCDIKTCPHNGCEQYRATVAHTAALAVGWSVPGCAMTWGGECTCGEKCKCSGCPTHNPAS